MNWLTPSPITNYHLRIRQCETSIHCTCVLYVISRVIWCVFVSLTSTTLLHFITTPSTRLLLIVLITPIIIAYNSNNNNNNYYLNILPLQVLLSCYYGGSKPSQPFRSTFVLSHLPYTYHITFPFYL